MTEHIETSYEVLSVDDSRKVHGIALGIGDVTRGASGKETFWPEETLKDAADALEGQPIALPNDHTVDDPSPQTPPEDIVGGINWSGYAPGVGVVYEGELDDESLAEKVSNGRLEVSPQIVRDLAEYNGDEAAYKGESINHWRDLALVAHGAAPSNDISAGTQPMKAEALHETIEELQEDTNETMQEQEALKFVAGVEFTGTKDGELDASKIEDNFGDHYLYGEGEDKEDYGYPVVDVDGNLRKGNVDSAWQLGARGGVDGDEHDEKLMALAEEFENSFEWAQEDEESMSDGETKSIEALQDVPDEFVFSNPGEAVSKADDMGITEGQDLAGDEMSHSMKVDGETVFMPGESHDDLMEFIEEKEDEEAMHVTITDEGETVILIE